MNTINYYLNLAHEITSEYNDADNPGLLRQKITEALADVVQQAIKDERERCAKVLTDRADELQVEWDAPPSAANGFIAMTADTPAGYAIWYCMNLLRKLATAMIAVQHGEENNSLESP